MNAAADRDRIGTAADPASGSAIAVEVSDTQDHLTVRVDELAGLVRRTLAREGLAAASISLALVDDATIRVINRRHLDHDWPTDVITFRLSEPSDPVLAAELVVSAEMAAATARDAGVDPRAELALYVVHGLLHLCGYDDSTEAQSEAIRRREAEVLAAEGLANTFAAPELAGEGPRWSS